MPPQPDGPEKIAFQGKMIEVVEQPMRIGEKRVTFEFARRAPGTRIIIPLHDGNILLTKEYRPSLKSYDFRVPGGKVFDSLYEYNTFLKSGIDITEATMQGAIKEAKEEAGISIEKMELFAISKAGASVEWDLYYFVVTAYTEGAQAPEEHEDISLAPTPREEVKAMCLDGRIQEDRSALMLLRYLQS
ncbi:MAG: NUDIX domain-containing protein [Minisyncoccia bacterium]